MKEELELMIRDIRKSLQSHPPPLILLNSPASNSESIINTPPLVI
jgi:hypothetical protein